MFCGKIYRKDGPSHCVGQASYTSAEMECVVTPIGSGREVVTSMAVSCAHPHLFIALADGHCMRWTFSPSPDPSSTIIVESTSDLIFPKTSDARMGPIHTMHASPYGSYLTMTRSSQSSATQSLRFSRSIYLQRCNTDTVIFPLAVAASTAYFVIPWNGAAALELYATCQRSSSYWKDVLSSIWLLVCDTSLLLENAFRGLQASRLHPSILVHVDILASDHVRSAHWLSPHTFSLRRGSHVHSQARGKLCSRSLQI
jgi:hypothetical protein